MQRRKYVSKEKWTQLVETNDYIIMESTEYLDVENEIFKCKTQTQLRGQTHERNLSYNFISYQSEVEERFRYSLLCDFFTDIFADDIWKKWFMLYKTENGEKRYNNFELHTIEEIMHFCDVFCDELYDLYFCPAVCRFSRNDRSCFSTRDLVIDIDDLKNFDFNSVTEESIKTFLKEHYCVPDFLMPNWTVLSGHGLHLHYIIDKIELRGKKNIENKKMWQKYADSMITFFEADMVCRNISHIYRVPFSHNCKRADAIKEVKLFCTNASSDTSIERLNFFLQSEEAIKIYFTECNRRKTAKWKATMEANGTKPGPKGPRKVSEEKEVKVKKSNSTEIVPIELEILGNEVKGTSRYTRMLHDLHNYAALRKGIHETQRNIFSHIYVSYCKKCRFTEEHALESLMQYIHDDFYEEARYLVEKVYEHSEFMYSNAKVAELLGFSESDYKFFVCNYDDREEAHKKSNRKYYRKKTEVDRAEREASKKELYEAVKESMRHFSVRELAELSGVSKSKIHRIIQQIKEEEKAV